MSNLKKILDNLSIYIIYALALLLPVFFTPLTTEYFETGKFFLLTGAVLILFLIWGIRILVAGKLEINKTPLDIFLILLIVVAALSTVLSQSKSVAIFGLLPKMYGGLIYIIAVTLAYFLIIFNLKNAKQVLLTTNLMVFGGLVLAVFTLISYFKLQTSIPLVGNLTTSALYLSLLLPLTIRLLFSVPALGVLVNLIFAACIVLAGNQTAWIAAIFATVVTLLPYRKNLRKILPVLLPIALVIIVLAALSYAPNLANRSPLGNIAKSTPKDIQLPFNISWKVSASAFRDAPFLGTGPATYTYNITQYKPVKYNSTDLWNVRLNSAHNLFLQTLAELGGLGLALLLAISLTFVLFALKEKRALAIAGVTFILIAALSPMNVLIFTAGFIIMALAYASREKQNNYEISFAPTQNGSFHPLLPTLIFLPILALAITGSYFTVKLAIGEYYHRQAMNSIAKNDALTVYNNLVKAEQANPYADVYRVDLAQTSFAIANAIASQKGPTEASPAGSLTDKDKANIQQFLQQSIAEGRNAVAISPKSAANWEILATIYRQISGVARNAQQFSLDAYGRAIQLDPLNPLLRLSVGGVYYQLKNYDLAVRFFDDAVSLKPDYANALYNLAIALRDKGSLQEATLVAERLVSLLSKDTNSKDYQLASNLLAELKAKTPSDTEPTTSAPSALEKKDLPKVIDLPAKQDIATPAAVKK